MYVLMHLYRLFANAEHYFLHMYVSMSNVCYTLVLHVHVYNKGYAIIIVVYIMSLQGLGMSLVTCAWGASIVFGPAVSGKNCLLS